MSTTSIHVYVPAATAIRRGSVASGARSVPVSPELLAGLSPERRAVLAPHCSAPGEPPAPRPLHADGFEAADLVAALDREIEAARQAEANRQAVQVQVAARQEARIQEALAAPLSDWIEPARSGDYYQSVEGALVYQPTAADHPQGRYLYQEERADARVAARQAEAERLLPAAQAAWQVGRDAYQARKAAEAEGKRQAAETQAAEEAAWIGAHGSERLRLLLAGGYEYGACCRDERLAVELPDWSATIPDPEGHTTGSPVEPRNPPLEALKAAKAEPEAVLRYVPLYRKADEDDDSDDIDQDGDVRDGGIYVLVRQHLGREVYRLAE